MQLSSFPGMGSSPRGTLSNLSILWLQSGGGRILINVGIQTKVCVLPIFHSWPSGNFLLLGFWLHSNSGLSPLAWHKLPSLTLLLHHDDLRLSWHLPTEHGDITQNALEMRESFSWGDTREYGKGREKGGRWDLQKSLKAFKLLKINWYPILP